MNHLKGIQQEHKIYEQVNRMRSMCRDIYDFAKVTGPMDYNPLEVIQIVCNKAKKNMLPVSKLELSRRLRAIFF